jgi:hypothetical protein
VGSGILTFSKLTSGGLVLLLITSKLDFILRKDCLSLSRFEGLSVLGEPSEEGLSPKLSGLLGVASGVDMHGVALFFGVWGLVKVS